MQKTKQTFDQSNQVFAEFSLTELHKQRQNPKNPQKALLLINTAPDDTLRVIKDLKAVKGVNEVYPIKGKYDIIAIVEAESFKKLKEVVSNRIKDISNVKAKLTLTLIEN